MQGRSERFIGNLQGILDMCRQQGTQLVVMNQMTQSETFPRAQMKGRTYQSEVEYLRTILASGGRISPTRLYFYAHSRLMADLESSGEEERRAVRRRDRRHERTAPWRP